MANGNWTITYQTPSGTSFCSFYFGTHTLNFSQTPGTGNLQGTTTTNYSNPSGGGSTPMRVDTVGTVDSTGRVTLTLTLSATVANAIPSGCTSGNFFSSVQINVTNGVAVAAPPETRARINGAIYTVSAQGNSQTGNVSTLSNP